MNSEQGRKGGMVRPGVFEPIAQGHGDTLPIRQFARQAKSAHPAMDTVADGSDDGGMPAHKPIRPAPTTLRKWRLHRALTLEQVGNIVGKGAQAVHKWETGKTPVDIETLKTLAQIYDTTPDALLFDPSDEDLIRRMRAAHDVLKTLPPGDADSWPNVGRAMSSTGKPK